MPAFTFTFNSTFAGAPIEVDAWVEQPAYPRRAPDDPETEVEIQDVRIGGVSIQPYEVLVKEIDGAISTLGNKLEHEALERLAIGEAA